MSIENILKRIGDEAEGEAHAKRQAAEARAAAIREEYERGAAALAGELERAYREKAAVEERRLVVAEELELRKKLLERKREILAEIYREARNRVEGLPPAEYLDLMRSLILRNAASGREEIVVPAAHRQLFTPAFVDALNRARDGASFRLADEPGGFAWGVVLREGQRLVDLTSDVIFRQLAARSEARVAAALFPD